MNRNNSNFYRSGGSGQPPASGHRAGFTLAEILTVIAIMAILMTMTGVSIGRGRELARRARAETELREMVTAWLQYYQLYGSWPGSVAGKSDAEVTGDLLEPLINSASSQNERGITFLNLALAPGQKYEDPWSVIHESLPYRLTFETEKEVSSVTALRTSVSFPNRQRRFE